MARSHHRKKHKSHVKQFKQSHDTTVSANSKGKASWIIAIAGALVGFAITFFASGGSIIWMIAFTVLGGVVGYYIGKKMDEDNQG
jgi:hypothetical protein